MPLPKPQPNQDKNTWMQSCMSNETMKREYPDTKQRVAICYSQWRNKNKSDDEITKCIKCGLKDAIGYFCRYDKNGKKFYYDINDVDSKKLAKSNAEEFGLDEVIKSILLAVENKQEEPGDGRNEPIDGNTDTRPPSYDENKREEFIKECIAKKVGQGESETTAREQCIQEWDSKHKSIDYIVPKSKDEIGQGTVISYKGKIGKVLKVLNK